MSKEPELPRVGKKELLILDGLGSIEKYGLELVRESAKQLKRGTIYVTLQRMEDKGLVESRVEEKDPTRPGIPRRLYRVTGHGAMVRNAYQAAEAVMHGAEVQGI